MNFTVTAFPGKTFTGTVAAVEPAGSTTSNVVTYVVRIAVDPPDVQLLTSMTARVTIITQSAGNALEVPNSAIAWAQSQPGTQQSGGQRQRNAQGPNAQPPNAQTPNAQHVDPAAPNASVFVLHNGAPIRVPIQTGITDGSPPRC